MLHNFDLFPRVLDYDRSPRATHPRIILVYFFDLADSRKLTQPHANSIGQN